MKNQRRSMGQARSIALTVAGLTIALLSQNQPASAAAAGRPIISNGTVKTADGQLLRGCHAHIVRNTAITDFFTNLSNVEKMRDQAHMNVIRIGLLTPEWGGLSTPDEKIAKVDAIVANCEAAGIYAIINCHGPFPTDGTSAWDLKKFWDIYAPRYKDKPFVIYEISNETFAPTTPNILPENGWGGLPALAAYIASAAKDHIRPVAPNNMIFHLEPVGVSMNWGPYLVNTYAPAAGIQWNSGKDAWAFHAYGPNVVNTAGNVRATQSYGAGIPVICTEYSFWEEGWSNANVDGYHCPAEWCERNGISWIVWQQHQTGEPDQLKSVMNYLLPDATSRNWAWWNIRPPSVPQNVSVAALDSYSARVTWSAPADTGGCITCYIVYRDDKQFTAPNAGGALGFTDTGLTAATTYSYSVQAATLGGITGPRSPIIQVTMPTDNAPPAASLVSGIGDGKHVHVIFTERVDRISAQTIANFSISGVTISAATLGSDLKTLILTTSILTKGTAYTLTIANIRDLAPTPNVMASGAAYPFQYTDGVTRIRFFPRAGMAARMPGGVFEATSGSSTNGPYAVLYTIPATPPENAWSEISEAQWTTQTGSSNFDRGYRYFRYRSPDAGSCNVAEIEFYYGTVKATGPAFGTPGSYNNSGNDYTKAFDGNTTTFYDYSSASGGYAGLDLGERSGVGVVSRAAGLPTQLRVVVRHGGLVQITGISSSQPMSISACNLRGGILSTQSSQCRKTSDSSMQFRLSDASGRPLAPGQYVVTVKARGIVEHRTIGILH